MPELDIGGDAGGGGFAGIPTKYLILGGGGLALALFFLMNRGKGAATDTNAAPNTLGPNASLALGSLQNDLRTQVGDLEQLFSGRINDLSTHLDANALDLTGQVGTLGAQWADTAGALTTAVGGLSGQIGDVSAGIGGLGSQVSTLSGQVGGIGDSLSGQIGGLGSMLGQQFAGLGSQVSAVGGQVGALGAQTSAQYNNLSTGQQQTWDQLLSYYNIIAAGENNIWNRLSNPSWSPYSESAVRTGV